MESHGTLILTNNSVLNRLNIRPKQNKTDQIKKQITSWL